MNKFYKENDDNFYLNAILNYRLNQNDEKINLSVMADGFFKASLILTRECIEKDTLNDKDVVIFPMVFCLNHGIELYEKSIIYYLNDILDNKDTYKRGHDIYNLWEDIKKLRNKLDIEELSALGFEENEECFLEKTKVLEDYLKETTTLNTSTCLVKNKKKLYLKEITSFDFPRYSKNSRGENQFYLKNKNNMFIDLENALTIIENIYSCLKDLSFYYAGILEALNERYTEEF